jgi:ADP-ribosylglycohydrolase
MFVCLGIPLFHDLSEVAENTARICKATHADPRCLSLSVWVASMVALLLQVNSLHVFFHPRIAILLLLTLDSFEPS